MFKKLIGGLLGADNGAGQQLGGALSRLFVSVPSFGDRQPKVRIGVMFGQSSIIAVILAAGLFFSASANSTPITIGGTTFDLGLNAFPTTRY